MENCKTWELVKTVAGAFIIVYSIQGGWHFAKECGRREALKEMLDNPRFEKDWRGDAVVVNIGGKRYKMHFEKTE